jgi:integrase
VSLSVERRINDLTPQDFQAKGIRPWIRRKIEADKSLRKLASRVLARGGSGYTAQNYVKDVSSFCVWLKVSPDQALASKYDWPALVNEYLDYLYAERKLAPSAGPRAYAAIKKWLAINEVLSSRDLAWDKVELGRTERVETEELPNKETLRSILASGDLAEKTLALIAISSGLRIGSILQLQLKHIDLEREVPLVSPPPETTKNRRRFHTFISPEAKEVLLQYLKDRELRAGTIRKDVAAHRLKLPPGFEERLSIGPDSYVIVAERPLGEPITQINSGDRRWINMVRRAGFDKKGKTWHTLHFHVLRKYFKTWTTVSGVSSDLVEYFMGHRASIRQVYFIPEGVERPPEEIIKRLEEEYRKALPALSITSETETVKKLEAQVEEQRKELEKDRARFETEKESWETKLEALTRQVNERDKKVEARLEALVKKKSG